MCTPRGGDRGSEIERAHALVLGGVHHVLERPARAEDEAAVRGVDRDGAQHGTDRAGVLQVQQLGTHDVEVVVDLVRLAAPVHPQVRAARRDVHQLHDLLQRREAHDPIKSSASFVTDVTPLIVSLARAAASAAVAAASASSSASSSAPFPPGTFFPVATDDGTTTRVTWWPTRATPAGVAGGWCGWVGMRVGGWVGGWVGG